MSGQHHFGFGIKIQIMGPCIGDGQVQRISVPPSGSPDSLHVIGLRRWYGTQNQ